MRALITGNGPKDAGPDQELYHGFSINDYVEIVDTLEHLNAAKCKLLTKRGGWRGVEYYVELHHLKIFR